MPALAPYYTISPSDDSALAVEITTTRVRTRRKQTLFFEKFSGEMYYAPADPASFKMTLIIDAQSVVCRDSKFALMKALALDTAPEIRFTSTSLRPKELRGFVVDGALQIRDTKRPVKFNVVLSPTRQSGVQLDGDATVRLSDFGLPRPSSWFGLIRTKDEALVRLILWAVPAGTR